MNSLSRILKTKTGLVSSTFVQYSIMTDQCVDSKFNEQSGILRSAEGTLQGSIKMRDRDDNGPTAPVYGKSSCDVGLTLWIQHVAAMEAIHARLSGPWDWHRDLLIHRVKYNLIAQLRKEDDRSVFETSQIPIEG